MGGVARIRLLRRRRARGMAMVEMIFVLPVLLIVVFSIAEVSLMFARWLTLITAVQEGARTAAAFRFPCIPAVVTAQVQNTVTNYARAGAIDTANLIINVGRLPGGPPCARGQPITVDANFPFTFNIPVPFASQIGTITLAYASTLRNE